MPFGFWYQGGLVVVFLDVYAGEIWVTSSLTCA